MQNQDQSIVQTVTMCQTAHCYFWINAASLNRALVSFYILESHSSAGETFIVNVNFDLNCKL